MGSLNTFVDRMEYWCNRGNLGYDQSNRWDIREGGECDCSSLVIFALREAGFDTGLASYTGDMSSELCARGWIRIPSSTIYCLQPGDILLKDVSGGHTEAYLGNNLRAGAHLDENGNICGGQSGDQTDRETDVREMNSVSYWDCILRYTGEDGGSNDISHEPVCAPVYQEGELEVDGEWGQLTTRKLQEIFSIVQSTYVEDQYACYQSANPGLLTSSFRWGEGGHGGSEVIKELQTKLGCNVDGYIGPDTISALQRYLGTDVDGCVDRPSPMVKMLQSKLNGGNF